MYYSQRERELKREHEDREAKMAEKMLVMNGAEFSDHTVVVDQPGRRHFFTPEGYGLHHLYLDGVPLYKHPHGDYVVRPHAGHDEIIMVWPEIPLHFTKVPRWKRILLFKKPQRIDRFLKMRLIKREKSARVIY